MPARLSRSCALNSSRLPACRRGITIASNGQTAQNGTMAAKCSLSQTNLCPDASSATDIGRANRNHVNFGDVTGLPALWLAHREYYCWPRSVHEDGGCRPHHCTPIFKYLHIFDERNVHPIPATVAPTIYHATKICHLHAGNRQIMTRRKAKYPTDSRFAPRKHQTIQINSRCGSVQAATPDSHCQKQRCSGNPDCACRQPACCPGTCSSLGRNSGEFPFGLAPTDLATGAESDEARPTPMSPSMD